MRTQSVAVAARSVIEHAGRSSMMIAGRGVAAPSAPVPAMRCADTMQKQQQLSCSVASSQPLTCTRRVVLAHR